MKSTKEMPSIQADREVYSYEEVEASAIKYFGGDELAGQVWTKKYALKDAEGNIYEKSPDEMHKRIATEFARIEQKYPNPLSYDEIYDVIKDFKYIVPQGSPMAGIGNNFQYVSISNCFVIGNEQDSDSYGGILKLDQELVQLMKRRGGVGLDLSFVRPANSPVMNSAMTSTGVVPFMERFSNSTREVAQGGRRGALMESIHIAHPDSEAFIDAKMEQGKVTGANVSVRLSDDFMKSVVNNEEFTLQFPAESSIPEFTKNTDAKKLWNKIIHNAWKSAEPGILFWDTIINESIADTYSDLGFKTVSTNPCGEIPLCINDSCRLIAINLYSYVNDAFKETAYFDYELFNKHVRIAQRLMDDLIDIELEKIDRILEKIEMDPEPESVKRTEKELWQNIKQKCIDGRRTGLGITAEGDMLAAMGLTYGSTDANKFSEDLHMKLKHAAYWSSHEMGVERGTFGISDTSREADHVWMQRIKSEDEDLYNALIKDGRRNIALLTIAPTGSVSILTQTSSGMEPAFLVAYMRRRKINPNDIGARVDFTDEVGDTWQEYPVFHHKFKDWYVVHTKSEDNVKEALENLESLTMDEIEQLIKISPWHKATSADIDWEQKVKMQGMVQKHVDHSISVTVNLPEDISEEMVSKVYMTGWEVGCKGLTVYRDGSRSGVLVSSSEKKEEAKEQMFKDNNAPKRPKKMHAEVVRFNNNLEKWIAVVGVLDGRPYEMFTGKLDGLPDIPNYVKTGLVIKTKSKDGASRYDFRYEDKDGHGVTIEGLSRSFDPEYWNYAKLISGIFRHGMPLPYVIELIGSLNLEDDTLNTWKAGVIRVIKKFIKDGTVSKTKCKECGQNAVVYSEGCLTCQACGHGDCG